MKLYKDGIEVEAGKEQLKILLEAGWSVEPVTEETEVVPPETIQNIPEFSMKKITDIPPVITPEDVSKIKKPVLKSIKSISKKIPIPKKKEE